jgi:hypothetical protein
VGTASVIQKADEARSLASSVDARIDGRFTVFWCSVFGVRFGDAVRALELQAELGTRRSHLVAGSVAVIATGLGVTERLNAHLCTWVFPNTEHQTPTTEIRPPA